MKTDNLVPPQLFHSIADLNKAMRANTIEVARRNGFDIEQAEPEGYLCLGKHSSNEVINVFSNGAWEYSAEVDNLNELLMGGDAVMLNLCLKDKELYIKTQSE